MNPYESIAIDKPNTTRTFSVGSDDTSSHTTVKGRLAGFAQKVCQLLRGSSKKNIPSPETEQGSTKPLAKYRTTLCQIAFRIVGGAGLGFAAGALGGAACGSLAMVFTSPIGIAIGAGAGALIGGLAGSVVGLVAGPPQKLADLCSRTVGFLRSPKSRMAPVPVQARVPSAAD